MKTPTPPMKFSLLFLLLLLLMGAHDGEAQQCGEQAGVHFAEMGCAAAYGDIVAPLMLTVAQRTARANALRSPLRRPLPPSPPTPPPSPPLPPSPGGTELSDIFPKELFEEFLLHHNDAACSALGLYTYKAFIEAARAFPDFGHAGGNTTRKTEIAAFFGQTNQETTAEVGPVDKYCVLDSRWPCVPGKK
ncbi:hypothetical protein Cgig2_000433 [Carnegiea gigantea]|uniref:Glycoside hydrolase family 19 catalytic domain-containing protein n=1 Tax=Carnegiea gigantea TaxID=171969 RepID=A0A9Q1JPE5_9CARY|nr:hypothetical protein Cgig2_000433 [Carnegiea gigantea]